MRLVCPNCGAQYEVDDRVIPDNGRDVQCSSCGHGWYQMPAHHAAAADRAAEPEVDDVQDLEDEAVEPASDETEEAAFEGSAAEPEARPETEDEPEDEAADEDEDAGAPEMPSAPRRALDDDLRSILQEEAEREMEARATERGHEAEAMEIQPELGLDEAPGEDQGRLRAERGSATAFEDEDEAETATGETTVAWDEDDDIVDVSGLQAAAAAVGATAATTAPEGDDKKARRELFPDIDEINSTLDSHGGFSEPDEYEDLDDKTGSFGRSFFAVIIVVAFLLALYLVAPQLAQNVPVLEPALSAYSGAIDALREVIYGLGQSVMGGGDAGAAN